MQYLIPKPGYDWNPLVKLPANFPCPCKQGRKFKKCCSRFVPRYVPKDRVGEWQKLFDSALQGARAW